MSGEEDEKELELKDLIVQTLESNGLLSKIKAQIRASVFTALDENEKNLNSSFENPCVKKLVETKEGRLAASLVREFLEQCNLDFTMSVFDPEFNINSIQVDRREKLVKILNLNDSLISSRDEPLLVDIVKRLKESSSLNNTNGFGNETIKLSNGKSNGHFNKSSQINEVPNNVLSYIKSRFDFYDNADKGYISFEKLNNLFIELFSGFNPSIIQNFLVDELNNSKLSESRIEFKDFLAIYKKWYLPCMRTASIGNDDADEEDFDDKFSRPNNNNALLKTSRFENGSKSKEDFLGSTAKMSAFLANPSNGNSILSNVANSQHTMDDENSKTEEVTVDHSISTIHGNNDIDYIEDISI